ncbi:MAG: hypothetical protein QXX36_01220 [Candidatus Rehaiarchaeum fermentans]|nr:hypothetical protein [Candidatus Rehaiarchaeum fermentans]MCW1302233.1 hypothetical protein [Candidatus Rehaiarchaeum fermentans]
MKVERYWIQAIAKEYNNTQIGEIYGNVDEIKDRRIIVYSSEIGYKNKNYKIYFKSKEINDKEAMFEIDKIELSRDYISRIIKKGTTKRDVVKKIKIDGKDYYVKVLVLLQKTRRKIGSEAKRKTEEFVENFFKDKNMKQIADEVIEGKAKEELTKIIKKIYPLKAVEIRYIMPAQ